MSRNRICSAELQRDSAGVRHHLWFFFFFFFLGRFSLKPQLCSVDWLQVSICCIMCHHTAQKKKKNSCCFCLCTSALCIFGGRELGLFLLACASRPFCNPVSILLPPEPPLALNNTSRHAVRDQLTLKLLDFTLIAPVPQMRVLQTVLLIYAQTLPEGTWWWGKCGLSYGTHVHPITEFQCSERANERRGNLKTLALRGRVWCTFFKKDGDEAKQ